MSRRQIGNKWNKWKKVLDFVIYYVYIKVLNEGIKLLIQRFIENLRELELKATAGCDVKA